MSNQKGSSKDCNPNTWTAYSGSCCKTGHQCGVGEGDCDYDTECYGNLECGTDNCGSEFPSGADCCVEPGIINLYFDVKCLYQNNQQTDMDN